MENVFFGNANATTAFKWFFKIWANYYNFILTKVEWNSKIASELLIFEQDKNYQPFNVKKIGLSKKTFDNGGTTFWGTTELGDKSYFLNFQQSQKPDKNWVLWFYLKLKEKEDKKEEAQSTSTTTSDDLPW